jgi:hypothetical protein
MASKSGLARDKKGTVEKTTTVKKPISTSKAKKSKDAMLAEIAGMTKASGAAKKASTTKLFIDGHEELVDELVERHKELESLEAEQELGLKQLREIGVEEMRDQEGDGEFHKTCRVKGSEQDIRVTRKDAFSKIAINHKPVLQDLVGSVFDTLFAEGCDLKLTVDPETFIAACEAAGLQVSKFFQRTDWIKPKKGFLEMRATLRNKMDETENEGLDAITDQFAYKSSVGFKG